MRVYELPSVIRYIANFVKMFAFVRSDIYVFDNNDFNGECEEFYNLMV